jgi:hypothetical protein
MEYLAAHAGQEIFTFSLSLRFALGESLGSES